MLYNTIYSRIFYAFLWLYNCVTCVTITHDITSYPLPKFKIKKSKMKSKNKINGKMEKKNKKERK